MGKYKTADDIISEMFDQTLLAVVINGLHPGFRTMSKPNVARIFRSVDKDRKLKIAKLGVFTFERDTLPSRALWRSYMSEVLTNMWSNLFADKSEHGQRIMRVALYGLVGLVWFGNKNITLATTEYHHFMLPHFTKWSLTSYFQELVQPVSSLASQVMTDPDIEPVGPYALRHAINILVNA